MPLNSPPCLQSLSSHSVWLYDWEYSSHAYKNEVINLLLRNKSKRISSWKRTSKCSDFCLIQKCLKHQVFNLLHPIKENTDPVWRKKVQTHSNSYQIKSGQRDTRQQKCANWNWYTVHCCILHNNLCIYGTSNLYGVSNL